MSKPAPSTDPLKLPKQWQPPRLLAWQQEALQHGWFDFAVPKFDWLVTSQAARSLHMGRQSVQNLADSGQLETRIKQITGTRQELTISRRSILLHIAANAQTDPRDFLRQAVEFVRSISCPRILAALQTAIAEELGRRAG